MMKGGNPIMFSRGIQMTNINGDIQKKEYQAMYDGNKSNMVLNDGNLKYYIEGHSPIQDDDVLNLFNQKPSNQNIETKLKLLINKPKKRKKKKKKKKKRKKTKKIRFKIPVKRKKIHYTVKKRSPSKSKRVYKKKTPSKSKTKKKSPSKKSTIQKLLPDKLLKTII